MSTSFGRELDLCIDVFDHFIENLRSLRRRLYLHESELCVPCVRKYIIQVTSECPPIPGFNFHAHFDAHKSCSSSSSSPSSSSSSSSPCQTSNIEKDSRSDDNADTHRAEKTDEYAAIGRSPPSRSEPGEKTQSRRRRFGENVFPARSLNQSLHPRPANGSVGCNLPIYSASLTGAFALSATEYPVDDSKKRRFSTSFAVPESRTIGRPIAAPNEALFRPPLDRQFPRATFKAGAGSSPAIAEDSSKNSSAREVVKSPKVFGKETRGSHQSNSPNPEFSGSSNPDSEYFTPDTNSPRSDSSGSVAGFECFSHSTTLSPCQPADSPNPRSNSSGLCADRPDLHSNSGDSQSGSPNPEPNFGCSEFSSAAELSLSREGRIDLPGKSGQAVSHETLANTIDDNPDMYDCNDDADSLPSRKDNSDVEADEKISADNDESLTETVTEQESHPAGATTMANVTSLKTNEVTSSVPHLTTSNGIPPSSESAMASSVAITPSSLLNTTPANDDSSFWESSLGMDSPTLMTNLKQILREPVTLDRLGDLMNFGKTGVSGLPRKKQKRSEDEVFGAPEMPAENPSL